MNKMKNADEGFSPRWKGGGEAAEEQDVEGHASRAVRAADQPEDVEGHRRAVRAADEPEDTEGHRRAVRAADEDDTEGHGLSRVK